MSKESLLFFPQDIASVWDKRRNDGKYPNISPIQTILTFPKPWSQALLSNFAAFINGRICLPNSLRGISLQYINQIAFVIALIIKVMQNLKNRVLCLFFL
jgi:hypothetical protein